jgi:hypothetical protein
MMAFLAETIEGRWCLAPGVVISIYRQLYCTNRYIGLTTFYYDSSALHKQLFILFAAVLDKVRTFPSVRDTGSRTSVAFRLFHMFEFTVGFIHNPYLPIRLRPFACELAFIKPRHIPVMWILRHWHSAVSVGVDIGHRFASRKRLK